MTTLLGVNIDHVATLRQARNEGFPDPVLAAHAAVQAGADGITAHLREDRRHIQDDDVRRLKSELSVPFNMEMAATPEIVAIAEKIKPAWVCLVPENRRELTTEGGLDVWAGRLELEEVIKRLQGAGIRVSLFVEPDVQTMEISKEVNADAVELHTGVYARCCRKNRRDIGVELDRIKNAAQKAAELKLLVNAGHGIDYENADALLKVYSFHEFNIGFAIVARALFVGFPQAVQEMKNKMRNLCAAS